MVPGMCNMVSWVVFCIHVNGSIKNYGANDIKYSTVLKTVNCTASSFLTGFSLLCHLVSDIGFCHFINHEIFLNAAFGACEYCILMFPSLFVLFLYLL